MAKSVGHDFANILAIINASAQLLADDGQADIFELLIERILQSCNQANDLVEDLMHFDTEPEQKVCSLNDLVRDVSELNSNQFLATQGFETLVTTSKLICETDPTLFSRMVFNLVKNAREAINENGSVYLSLEQIDKDSTVEPDFHPSAICNRGDCQSFPAARLIVRDDGVGMSQKALDTAFLPFQSTKGTGRGLGLVTVDALLQGQMGRMRAFSRPGEGTMVAIDLPLLDARAPRTFPNSINDPDKPSTGAQGALVIDDDQFQVDLVVTLLREFGWDAVGFTNPVAALGVFKVAPWAFELIVTDRRMPQMSGDELAYGMSEYMERHSVSRLIGAPPGYVGYEEGGYLTEAVRRRPYSVLLLDEVEKAHPDVFNILLQVLEDGRLTDGQGRTVDFRNTVIVMTSNLGSDIIQQKAGEENYEVMKNAVMEVVGTHFRPEFINRVDEVVVFHPLAESQIQGIARIQIESLSKRLKEQDMKLELDDAAMELLAEVGYDPVYGARPLKRAIQRMIENPLAQRLLQGEFVPGDVIKGTVEDHHLNFTKA